MHIFPKSFQVAPVCSYDVCIDRSRYQHNSSSSNLKQHLRLGKISFALRELYCTPVKRLKAPFGPVTADGHESCIMVRIAPVDTARGAEPVEVALEVAGLQELSRRDMCNPFMVMSRYAFGQWEPFLQTEKRVLELNPVRPWRAAGKPRFHVL